MDKGHMSFIRLLWKYPTPILNKYRREMRLHRSSKHTPHGASSLLLFKPKGRNLPEVDTKNGAIEVFTPTAP